MPETAPEQQQFDWQGFVRELASQAESVVPVDIAQDDKQYIVNIVYNFCNLACEAIMKENFSVDEVTLITQFIGEWTFHKSVDLVRAGITPQFRDSVLQKIAFPVFEIAKQAISKKLDQLQVIQVVEHHVKKAYLEALNELKEKNLITEDDYNKAVGESNIDKMAQENEQKNVGDEFSDSKILKLATLAMVLKKLPKQKVESIISKFQPNEAKILLDYMNVDDLSSKIDSNITIKYIKEIQASMPKSFNIKGDKLQNKFAKIVTKKNELKINDIIFGERSGIKNYIDSIRKSQPIQLPTRISNVIYSYLEEKLQV